MYILEGCCLFAGSDIVPFQKRKTLRIDRSFDKLQGLHFLFFSMNYCWINLIQSVTRSFKVADRLKMVWQRTKKKLSCQKFTQFFTFASSSPQENKLLKLYIFDIPIFFHRSFFFWIVCPYCQSKLCQSIESSLFNNNSLKKVNCKT